MADILVDTDIFIDHIRGSAELKVGRNRLHYSVVTRAELFAGNSANDVVSQLLAPFQDGRRSFGGRASGTSRT